MGDDMPGGIKYTVGDEMPGEITCPVGDDIRGGTFAVYKILSHN